MTSRSVSPQQVQEVITFLFFECMLSAYTHRQFLDDYFRLDTGLKMLQLLGLIDEKQYQLYRHGFITIYLKIGASK